MKEVGLYLSNNKDSLPKYIFISFSEEHRSNTLLAYLPLNSFAEKLHYSSDDILIKHIMYYLSSIA